MFQKENDNINLRFFSYEKQNYQFKITKLSIQNGETYIQL